MKVLTSCQGVDPELYELTTAKLDTGGPSSRVADAFARLMSTMEKTSTATRSEGALHPHATPWQERQRRSKHFTKARQPESLGLVVPPLQPPPSLTSCSDRKPRKEEHLSEEAAKVMASLPDLSFMQAKVLMFPATLTPLSSQATPD